MAELDYKKLWLQACKAYDTKNPSGCVCNIDEDASEVRSPCMLHKDWLENAVAAEREACEQAVRDEPELPGEIPQAMFETLRHDKDAYAEALRILVRLTKAEILARMAKRSNVD